MKTRIILCVLATLLDASTNLHAEEFAINDIKYNGDETTMTATVVGIEEGFNKVDVVIPEKVNGYTVTSIGDRAFRVTSIKSFVMPNTIKSIGYRAFYRCAELESVIVSNTLITIADMAFYECTSLKAIAFPESITEIGALAFQECSNIESIEIPVTAPLEVIQQGCFMGCSKMTSFIIPNSVKTIKDNAFQACSSLTSLYIPSSVTMIEYDDFGGNHPFVYCSALKSIVVDKDNPVYDSRNNCNAIIETAINKLMVGCMNSTIPTGVIEIGSTAFCEQSELTSIHIPNTVTTIGDMAFMESGLTSISIPASVTNLGLSIFNRCEVLVSASLPDSWESIPGSLFIFCRKLESVNIPSAVKSIGEMAFRRCESLKSIDLPNSIEIIGRQAFQGCVSLESITIPESVMTIERKAFENCYNLKRVTSLIPMPFEINEDVFQNVNDNSATTFTFAILYVPKGCKDKYKTTAGWNQFNTIMEEGEEPAPEGFSNNKLYTLTCKRGGLVLNADATGLAAGQTRTDAPESDKRFAIITYNNAQYLYSPVNKQYLLYDGSFVSRLGSPITFDNTHADGEYKFMLSTQNENGETWYFNNNGNIVINGWSTADDGNRWLIEPVADFDPTEALAMAAAQICTVTYQVKYESKVVATATVEVAKGSTLPAVPASLNNSFVTLTKSGTHPTTVTKDVTVNFTATWNGPFKFTKKLNDATWYYMHIRSGWYVSKQDTEPYYPAQAGETERFDPAYVWAFGGDPYHVKVYNYTTGLDETLTKDGENAVMRKGDYTWDLLPNSDGFVLRVTGTENSCINQYGGGGGPLKFWTDANSLTDDGSTFRVEDVTPLIDGIETIQNPQFIIYDESDSLFDLQGRKLAILQKGINIIRYSDGTTRKVLQK